MLYIPAALWLTYCNVKYGKTAFELIRDPDARDDVEKLAVRVQIKNLHHR